MTHHQLHVSRRTFSLSMAGLGIALLTACGDDAGSGGSGGSESTGGAGTWTPVTVKHAFGETVVQKEPKRIVSAGYTEQDFLLALGLTPVGVTDWYGDQPFGTWPWAQEALGGAKPTLLTQDDGFQFAEIAKLAPDLIIACNAGTTKEAYDKLSKIAPTIAQSEGGAEYFDPWTKTLDLVGQSTGKKAEADTVAAEIKASFTDAVTQHPNFKGKKAIFLQNAVSDGNLIAYQQGLSTDFLTDLGFVVPEEINPFIREGEQAYIPVERISVLNAADVLVWGTEKDEDVTALEKVPGFSSLNAVKAGKSIYTGGELAGAIYFTSPLSLPYIVDKLVPMLAKVLP